jgi:hypothetical protein
MSAGVAQPTETLGNNTYDLENMHFPNIFFVALVIDSMSPRGGMGQSDVAFCFMS